MIALLAGVSGAWADVNAPSGYVSSIETGVNYLWCLYDAANYNVRYIHADGTKTNGNASLTGAGIFQFEDAGDGYYYIKNVNSGNYIYTDYAGSVTLNESANGKPYACYFSDKSVLSAGTKADEDKFKWLVSAGSTTNGFFISSKANSNAVIAATGQGNPRVDFYQYTETYGGNAKYPFANSKFIKVATSLGELSNDKCYNICNYQAWWAVGSSATVVNSTYTNDNGLNIAVSTTDTKQQFAFIKYIDKYYLYSVGEGKFAYKNGTKLSLADGFNNNVTSNGAVTFVTSTSSSYKSSAPVVVTVATKNFGVSKNYTPTVYGYDDASDNGNASAVCEAGSFTPTTALAQIESSFLFEPSTDLAPKYYAWRTAVNNNASYIHIDNSGNPVNPNSHDITTTDPIDSKYAWYFIGDPENGYAIKNKSTGTYLGGQTASGGAMSMEATANCKFYPINEAIASPTWNTWYDKVHNYYIDRSNGAPYAHTSGNKNDYIRLYNVKFSLSNAAAGLVVGSTSISDFTAYYLITSSASLSCAESGYTITAYDGYGTLAEALTNDNDGTISLTIQQSVDVTFNLKWNGDVIKSVERAEVVGEAPTAATTVFGTVPAYSSYGTSDVATIASNTEEVNINLNWNGPFDFSTDYEHATWYCMQIGSKWVEAGTTSNGVTSTIVSNNARTENAALWAFIGNPYDGVSMVNKSIGNGYYLNSNAQGVDCSIKNTEEKFVIVNDNGTLRFKNPSGLYMELFGGTDIDCYYDSPEGGVCNMSVRSYYCQQLVDDLYAWADDNHRNELFGPSETWLSDKASQVTTMFPNMSKSTYDGITVPDAFAPVVPNYPSTGYYRIKSSGQRSIGESYIGYGSSDYGTGLRTVAAANKLSDASTVIKLTGSAGTYKLSTEGLNVQSQTGANAAFPATDAAGVDFVFSVSTPGVVTIRNAASASGECQGDLHEGQDGSEVKGVINWQANAAESKWTVEAAEEITISLNAFNGKSYATFSAPFDVTIDAEHATAYQIDLDTERNRAVYSAIEDNKVPAGAGVLIISDEAVSSVTATINTGSAFSALDGNDLVGYNIAPTFSYPDETTDWNLVLGVNSGTIGFYKMNGSGTASPNKAYLPYLHTQGEVKGFALEAEDAMADGVNTVQGSGFKVQDSEIYNLAGQRISKLQRGVNIVNGKKVIIK